MNRILIFGVGVNLDALKDCETIEDVIEKNIFEHLSEEDIDKANQELFAALNEY